MSCPDCPDDLTWTATEGARPRPPQWWEDMAKRAGDAARRVADAMEPIISCSTTTSIERAALRLLGVDGVTDEGVPLPNVVVERLHRAGLLGFGACRWFGAAMLLAGDDRARAVSLLSDPDSDAGKLRQVPEEEARGRAAPLAAGAVRAIERRRSERLEMIEGLGQSPPPLLYVIVATGNIYEDVVQARAAAEVGADCIAVIRSTAQSLLDYVPYGPTTEGYGGTYATQANFRMMRQALDDASRTLGRYVRLVNYCSGLCMPEIAAMGAVERLDMMLSDAIYGILFRNINMVRTLTDQAFSRKISAAAGIIINTGEDNYLTTADALEAAHTVTASQFINLELATRAGLDPWQVGLGHAFEIDPAIEDSLVLELAHAWLARRLFGLCPLKYMPPTRFMPGNIFQGHVMDAMFNVVGLATGQSVQLLGMLTEALHTPLLQDRYLALASARYIAGAARSLAREVRFEPSGKVLRRAEEVLGRAVELLERVAEQGLLTSIERGLFADIRRSRAEGRGLEGVLPREDGYFNPIEPELDACIARNRGSTQMLGDARAEHRARPREGIRGVDPSLGPAAELGAIKPYGDAPGDGVVQLSFTLPLRPGPAARAAAAELASRMGLSEPHVAAMENAGGGFSFFVVYGRCTQSVDVRAPEPEGPGADLQGPDVPEGLATFDRVNAAVAEHLGSRKIVVVAATSGTDAHTVGLDAIVSMKGYAGDPGLERYTAFRVHNLGSQVDNEAVVTKARDVGADAILVSQVVTQRNIHLANLTNLVELVEAEGIRDRLLLVVGGPRMTHKLAQELGFDAGFGPGTRPGAVARYLAREVILRARGGGGLQPAEQEDLPF